MSPFSRIQLPKCNISFEYSVRVRNFHGENGLENTLAFITTNFNSAASLWPMDFQGAVG